jgi:chaperonin cofactor prefoldin
MDDLNELPEASQDTRKELLDQQFSEIEAVEPEKPARARDEAGKFAAEVDKVAEKRPVLTAKPAKDAAPVEEKPWHKPPASWKKEYHEAWGKADPVLREYAYQREEQMRAGVEPLLTKAQLADKISEVSKPYLATIQGLGMDVPTAVKGLMEADHTMRTAQGQDKLAYFARLAQNYGVDLQALAGASPQQTAVDPKYHTLQQEVLQMRGEMEKQRLAREQAEVDTITSEIRTFAQDKEHFEAVRPVMVQMLRSGLAKDLNEAYTKAITLDPSISAQTAQQGQVDAAKRAAADKAAKSARAAAVSVRGATPGSPTTPKAQDRRSMLSEQLNNIEERL